MEELLGHPSVLSVGQSELHFSLGKAYEDLKDYEVSFQHYARGNDLVNKKSDFSLENTKSYFRLIRDSFSKEFIFENKNSQSYDVTPVFIVGMPRSGTSLTEQILASHTDVHGAGELDLMWKIFTQTLGLVSDKYQKSFALLTPKKIENAANSYISSLQKLSPSASFITDKMPMNFRYIGLIKSMFPKAKIIHCIRDPRDTCLSIYKCRFMGGHPFAYDQKNLAEVYKLYTEMMAYWHSILPGEILDFRYEDLIEDQKTGTKRLLDYCGLDWQDTCLDFHKTKRTVNTASVFQVKEPLYKTGAGYWKNYEQYLEKEIIELA
ncbi:MAG: sulfotransferase [Alphaproteobacteria bacterium]|nr:sulfotransferase [Alphaproteobacteria bacterium]